jgi:hypothetical protein
MVIPNISLISYHTSGTQGITMDITGTGFSKNISNNKVTIANHNCDVTSST